ncbi:DUF3037 domain-containing protein [Nostocoides sp. F2B08]|uniref:DUF3037 domain-containing protein n=1 Tax=Nostocoides sp. F2B08 TaxID=2653936 RepID=UPI00186B3659|nr:DUF3037 domain-containing protein [Tetrasphaera sp. F2B08]
MTLHPYQYVVLRCVPRIEREEFVNVGVVLYSQQADFLRCVQSVDEVRLRALDGDIDVAAVRASLTMLEEVCRGESGGGRPALESPGRRFGWITAPRSTVIQPGPVHGGLAENPEQTLEDLLDRLVR